MNRALRYASISFLLVMLAACATHREGASEPGAAGGIERLTGDWKGSIEVGARSIAIVVHLSRAEAGGGLQGTIDIPAQGAAGLPLADLVYRAPEIRFVLNAGSDPARFAGTLARGVIEGGFEQGPATGTFTLRPAAVAALPAPSSPPEEPEGEPVVLRTSIGTLYGTLVVPPGRRAVPAALIVSGSGPTDRDGNSRLIPGGNNSLRMVAEALERAGIASLRYDKRGVGESAGAAPSEAALRFETYVGDAAGWIRELRSNRRFTRVAIIGHSEGSLVAMAAAALVPVDAFVSLEGPGEPLDEVVKRQLATQQPAIRDEAYADIDALKAGRTVPRVGDALSSLFRPSVQPYLISVFRYDPRALIAKLTVPCLIVQGTTDLQVTVLDAERLHAAAPGSTLRIIPGMNHVLKSAPRDPEANYATYRDPDLPLAPGLVAALTGFLRSALR